MPRRGGLLPSVNARIFGSDFRPVRAARLDGVRSRARVSPQGRYGAATTFVVGHSYREKGFSTLTALIDMKSGDVLANLEDFDVTRDGKPFKALDFNFWGVTFTRDERRFYATLSTGGKIYLVEGDIPTRQARVIAEDVECPSLSPDERRIAFKRREGNDWRLHVLDLETKREVALAETRSVDDQVEWLDNDRILYGLIKDVWVVPADGSGRPRVYIPNALSPAVVRS
jgi:dipeptidyl aminopeptidase/acylaminoacyl peptidase